MKKTTWGPTKASTDIVDSPETPASRYAGVEWRTRRTKRKSTKRRRMKRRRKRRWETEEGERNTRTKM